MMAAYRELLVWQQRQIHPSRRLKYQLLNKTLPQLPAGNASSINPSLGIRYEQAAVLKQEQIERGHKQQLDALLARIEALESV